MQVGSAILTKPKLVSSGLRYKPHPERQARLNVYTPLDSGTNKASMRLAKFSNAERGASNSDNNVCPDGKEVRNIDDPCKSANVTPGKSSKEVDVSCFGVITSFSSMVVVVPSGCSTTRSLPFPRRAPMATMETHCDEPEI